MSEPKLSDVLKAITDLGDRTERRFAAAEHEMSRISAEVSGLRHELSEFRIETRTRLDGIDKRMDEQGRYVAALIPTRLAAVPRDEERRPS